MSDLDHSHSQQPLKGGTGMSRLKMKFQQGELIVSTVSLVTATLGAGIITLPYLALINGIVLSSLLITFGAVISYFWSMLLVKWADEIDADSYEAFAEHWYGPRAAQVTSWINICTLMGFVVSYIVFVKTLVPHIFEVLFGVHDILGMSEYGSSASELLWAIVYTIFILIPLSLAKNLGTLRYNSMFGVMWCFYLMSWFIWLFLVDRSLVPSISKNIADANYFIISSSGLVTSIPFVVFAFMYQPNVPLIYRELNNRSYNKIHKVLIIGSCGVVVIYVITWAFGYLGLVNQPEMLSILYIKSNILQIDYENWAFNIAILGLLFWVFAAAPMSFIPAKAAYEQSMYGREGMTRNQNIVVTICMCMICLLLAVAFPGISEVITVLGCTTNPMTGFILPIVFYLKIIKDIPLYKKVIWWAILIFMVLISWMGMYQFWNEKLRSS